MNSVVAIVLGGGAGSRLFPLTYRRSKPAVPLAGKYRLIDVPLSNCINSGIDRIFVLTQYNSASLNRHIARAFRFDQFRRGFVSILAAEQTPGSSDWFQGTADAVRQSLQHVRVFRHEHVLILSGDQLYRMNYRKLMDHHRAKRAQITIATIPVTADEAPGFGILKTDDQELVNEFYEKPALEELDGKESRVTDEMASAGRTYLASMGIYVFEREVLEDLLDRDSKAHDFGKQIIPNAISSHRVVSYPFTGYWSDIGTIRSFYEANLMLAKPKPDFNMFDPKAPLYTNARMLPPAKIEDSHVTNSMIAESAVVISSEVIDSVIGLRSYVGHNTKIVRSIIMGADYYPWEPQEQRLTIEGPERPGIGAGTVVANAIVDRNASIGQNCTIANEAGVTEMDGDGFYIRDGIVVVPKNASIPDGTVI